MINELNHQVNADEFWRLNQKTVNALKNSDFHNALTYAEEAYSFAKNNLVRYSNEYNEAANNLAVTYIQMERTEEGIKLFKSIISKDIDELNKEEKKVYGSYYNNIGEAYLDLENYEDALYYMKISLQLKNEVFGANDPYNLGVLEDICICLDELGKREEMVPYLIDIVRLSLSYFGEGSREYAMTLSNLENCYLELGKTEEAAFIRNGANKQKPKPPATKKNYDSLVKEAKLAYKQNNFEKAKELHQKILDQATIFPNLQKLFLAGEFSMDPLLPDVSDFNKKAYKLQESKKFAEAEQLYQISLNILQNSLGRKNKLYAQVLNNYGNCLKLMQKYDEAIPLLIQGKEIVEDPLHRDEKTHESIMSNLAACFYERCSLVAPDPSENFRGSFHSMESKPEDYTRAPRFRFRIPDDSIPEWVKALQLIEDRAIFYESIGDYEKTIYLHEQNCELAKIIYKDDLPSLGSHIHDLAIKYLKTGKLDQAESILMGTLDDFRYGDHHYSYQYLMLLQDLAFVYGEMGSLKKCSSMLTEAVDIAKEILEPEDAAINELRENLVVSYIKGSDTAKAKPLIEQLEREKDLSKSNNAIELEKYASFELQLERYDRGESLYLRAKDILKAEKGEYDLDYALCLSNLATLYRHTGRFNLAEPLYNEVVRIRKTELGSFHPKVSQALVRQALTCAAINQPEKALQCMHEIAEIDSIFIDQAFSITSDRDKLSALRSVSNNMSVYFSIVKNFFASDKVELSKCFESLQKKKNIIIEALRIQRQISLSGQFPETEEIFLELSELNRNIAAAVMQGSHQFDSKTAFEQLLKKAMNKKNSLEAKLSRALPKQLLGSHFEEFNAESIAGKLPGNCILIEIVRHHQMQFNANVSKGETESIQEYFMFVVKKQDGGDVKELISLGNADSLDTLINDLRHLVVNQESGYISKLSELSSRIVPVILPIIKESTRLIIAPDGNFCFLPFEMLLIGPEYYLIDDFEISYVGVGRDILKFGRTNNNRNAPIVMADPDYFYSEGSVDGDIGQQRQNIFLPLAGSKKEGQTISALLGVPLISGKEVTKKVFTDLISPSILHISTHGFFQNLASIEDQDSIENPLLKAGLALTGANMVSDKQLGVLTADEVTSLSLDETKMAVLSACDTGVGEVADGAGVYGLQYAFKLAGAERLVMSLWKAHDEVTNKLMEIFYRKITDGEEISAALRAAKLIIKSESPEPIYWAPFILHGNPEKL
jgi:CHAT domain-containing protein